MSPRFCLAALPLLLAATHTVAAIEIEDRPLSTAAPAPRPAAPAPVAAPAPTTAAAPEKPAASDTAPAAGDSGNSNWELYTQVQQLQQDLGQLRGTVEQQSHLIEKLQTDLRSRYMDLDQRLSAQQDQLKQQATSATTAASAPGDVPASATLEEEKKAYLAAYETFRAGGPDKAIPPMLAFVKRYPASTFVPSAYYWLGEFYLNAATPDPASAQKHFETVLAKYPDHAKAPAALYKIGSILDLQGKPLEAKKKMQELLAKYPKSPEAALADSYLKALEASSKPAAPEKPAAKPESKAPAAKKTVHKTH